jgi:hypothetical protein
MFVSRHHQAEGPSFKVRVLGRECRHTGGRKGKERGEEMKLSLHWRNRKAQTDSQKGETKRLQEVWHEARKEMTCRRGKRSVKKCVQGAEMKRLKKGAAGSTLEAT